VKAINCTIFAYKYSKGQGDNLWVRRNASHRSLFRLCYLSPLKVFLFCQDTSLSITLKLIVASLLARKAGSRQTRSSLRTS